MFERFFRRGRRENNTESAPDDTTRERSLKTSEEHNHEVVDNTTQSGNVGEALLSPSIASLTPPATPHTPDIILPIQTEERTYKTNGEYYDQILLGNFDKLLNLPHSSPPNANIIKPRPSNLKHTGTLRGMPPPKRTPISTSTPGVDPRSPLLAKESSSSPADIFMAPLPPNAPNKRDLNKPKSLNLKSSAFTTLTKGIHPPSSSSTIQHAPKPSPSTSIVSRSSTNTKKCGRSPLMSAPELGGSKWKGVIPQFSVPQTSVPWRSRSKSSGRRWKRQASASSREGTPVTSASGSMPGNQHAAAMHISPPILSNMSVEDPIPSAFLTSGSGGTNIASARSNYYQSLPSAASAVSHRSTASTSSKLPPVRSTELVVRKNSRFDVSVSSGKSVLFG
ncbi:hypothetical protein V8F33_006679 [Rhypophila sp. PSN 637]